ncbi:hypothetical protein Dsin_005907 [Dipteronia sinensis]|uniref:AIPP2-like SPOC-like domain-containing protein n=1 Tax=Dipteronia sinensis TaxID=43782 RepID=A0AAE0EGX9_9ROSI|nr:hypothetical protein Dsin_005907 [Dipteronia sinensis]
MEGQPSEPHHQDKPCDKCGAVGMKHTIVTCSKCCIAREHVYCMKVYTKIIPRIWVCEECLWRDNVASPNSVREDEFLDSWNIAHTAAPSRVSVDSQGQFHHKKPKAFETGKVKFLPYAEAQRLSSGAQGKKYREINYSRTAMQSKNVTPNLSVLRVKENPSLKHPGIENSRLSLGAQGKESHESNNSRKAMPAKNVIPEFPIPRVKEHPSFKLPVADISRLTSGAQGKEAHESNNSRTAMPAKNVIPNFSLPRVNANLSSQLTSHGGAQINRKIGQKTPKKSEKSKEKCGDKKRPKEAEILKPKTKEVKTPYSNSDYSRNEASYGSSTPICSIPISTGQTLHAVAGNNCSFEERDLPNILPKLERYLPSLEATWNGEFLFSDTATPGERYGGFVAHPPCKIHYKAFEFAQKFPIDLQVKLLPRCPLWEELFGDRTPDFRDIALYFFPADNTERSKHYYSSLFDFLESKNIVMRSYVAGVELLISTSRQLDVDSRKIIARSSTKNFLWGVFCRAKADEILHKVDEELLPSLVSPMECACDGHADEGVDMDIDMEGGNAMDEVDVPPGYKKISMLKSRITREKSGLVDGGVKNHKEVEKIGFWGVSEQPQRSPIAFKLTRSEKPRQKPASDNPLTAYGHPLSENHSRKREKN